jgi:hypothetical protein
VLRNSLLAELGVFGFFAFFALMRSCLTKKWSGERWRGNPAVLTEFLPANSLGVGIEAEENTLVDQWVLVLSPWALGDLGIGRSDNSLDHGAVDDTSDIWVGYLGGGETEDFE